MSYNGPQFISTDSAEFTKTNGIKHTRSLPYHPAMNGEAERFVHTFKAATKTGKGDGLTGGEFPPNVPWVVNRCHRPSSGGVRHLNHFHPLRVCIIHGEEGLVQKWAHKVIVNLLPWTTQPDPGMQIDVI